MTLGSNVTCTASAWPVVSVQTASYEGLARPPPEYPTSTFSTPRSSWKIGWRHQKHPPAIVVTSRDGFGLAIMSLAPSSGFLEDEGLPCFQPNPFLKGRASPRFGLGSARLSPASAGGLGVRQSLPSCPGFRAPANRSRRGPCPIYPRVAGTIPGGVAAECSRCPGRRSRGAATDRRPCRTREVGRHGP